MANMSKLSIGKVVGAVLVLGVLSAIAIAVFMHGGIDGSTSGQSTHGTVRFAKGDRTVSIAVSGYAPADSAAAQIVGKAPKGIRVHASPPNTQGIRLILNKKAPAPVNARWTVVKASGERSSNQDLLPPLILLTVVGLALLLGGFLLTHISATGSVLFAGFARVLGLLMTAGVGLVAAVIASNSVNAESFTALFTLLGLIAGYLAGSKSEPQQDPDDPDDGGGGGGGGPPKARQQKGAVARNII